MQVCVYSSSTMAGIAACLRERWCRVLGLHDWGEGWGPVKVTVRIPLAAPSSSVCPCLQGSWGQCRHGCPFLEGKGELAHHAQMRASHTLPMPSAWYFIIVMGMDFNWLAGNTTTSAQLNHACLLCIKMNFLMLCHSEAVQPWAKVKLHIQWMSRQSFQSLGYHAVSRSPDREKGWDEDIA